MSQGDERPQQAEPVRVVRGHLHGVRVVGDGHHVIVSLASRVGETEQGVDRHQPVMDLALEAEERGEELIGEGAIVRDQRGVPLCLQAELLTPRRPWHVERLLRMGTEARVGEELKPAAQRDRTRHCHPVESLQRECRVRSHAPGFPQSADAWVCRRLDRGFWRGGHPASIANERVVRWSGGGQAPNKPTATW